MLNYQETYSRMADDELLRLVPQFQTLTEAAQAALTAEMDKRKLKAAFQVPPQVGIKKSAVEKLMFWLFICSAIIMVFHELWPSLFLSTNVRIYGFYEMVEGFGQMFSLWLIIWLVLMARRLARGA